MYDSWLFVRQWRHNSFSPTPIFHEFVYEATFNIYKPWLGNRYLILTVPLRCWCSCCSSQSYFNVNNNYFHIYLVINNFSLLFVRQIRQCIKASPTKYIVWSAVTTLIKTKNNIKFYNFPNQLYEQEVKIKWIKAINRLEWDIFTIHLLSMNHKNISNSDLYW